jgi:hypothetical protein
MIDSEFLTWIYARLADKHGEDKNVDDYMRRLRAIIDRTAEQEKILLAIDHRAVEALEKEREAIQWRVNPEPGRTKLTRAQRVFLTLLLREARGENEGIGSHSKYDYYYFNTTQLRRLLPFVRANAHLIEELPRTPRGGWGYRLKDGVDPSKMVIP